MTPKLPVPTDNVYKFYALFGLVVLLSSALAAIYTMDTTNQRVFEILTQIGKYKEDGQVSSFEEGQIKMLEELKDVAQSNKDFYLEVLGWTFSISLYAMLFGFFVWHTKIQKRYDRLAVLKIKQMERDLRISQMPKKPKKHPWR